MITGWALKAASREALLKRFPPAFDYVLAHHVTSQVRAKAPLASPKPAQVAVVGELIRDGIQVLLVEVDGTILNPSYDGRPNRGGPTYHVTWSIDGARGIRPKESNVLLRAVGPENIARFDPIAVDTFPVIMGDYL